MRRTAPGRIDREPENSTELTEPPLFIGEARGVGVGKGPSGAARFVHSPDKGANPAH
jgi:hypothetical protein